MPQAAEAVPNNLPSQATAFIGRAAQLEGLRQQLLGDSTRLLTLTGAGGTGKTRLALQTVAGVLDAFRDGVYFVSFATISDADLVPSLIARVLDMQEVAGRPPGDALKDHLRHKSLLLLLDNFEHVVAAAPFVAELLASSPALKVVVTSRAVLHLYGEHTFPVPPLALPDQRAAPRAQYASQFEAVHLFVDRARAARPDFLLTDDNAASVVEICRRLDGLPLALELAAARLRALTPSALLGRMEHRLPLLTGGPRDLPARQQTLRNAVAWSYELLTSDEQRLFRRLAVFQGCTLAAVEAVCCAASTQPGSSTVAVPPLGIDPLDGVASLIDKSLLRREDTADGEPWYTMLGTVREYALERLTDSDEAESIRRRHVVYYLGLAESAERELLGPPQATWFARLEREHDNLRAALRYAEERGYAEPAFRLAVALWWFWAVRGHATEGRERLAGLLERFRSRAVAGRLPGARARALHVAGNLAAFQNDNLAAARLYEEALRSFRALDDGAGIEAVSVALARIASLNGDYPTARTYLEEVLDRARARGDRTALTLAAYNLANVVHEQGDYDLARALLEECLALKHDLGSPARATCIGLSTIALGVVMQDRGDNAAARSLYERAAATCREPGDRRALALALANLGGAAAAERDFAAAHCSLAESIAVQQELGDLAGVAFVLERYAGLAAAQDQPARAVRLAGAAAALHEIIDAPLPPEAQAKLDVVLRPMRSRLGVAAAREAWAAGQALSPEAAIAEALCPPTLPAAAPAEQRDGSLTVLTRREQEVATLLAHGYKNRQIAAELIIAERTAANHVEHILSKLGASSRAQVAVWAAEHGLRRSDERHVVMEEG
jgi:predicted ATPase/DNA-binding CsgD family transcriptional regulator